MEDIKPLNPDLPILKSLTGFSRASWVMDLTAIALAGVVIALGVSIYLSRARYKYSAHRTIQIVLSVLLAIVIILFEIDVRTDDWQLRAMPSPYFNTWLFPVLYVHLAFSISTSILWVMTLINGLKSIPVPPRPTKDSSRHKLLGWLSTLGMLGTALTGWAFYWLGFIL